MSTSDGDAMHASIIIFYMRAIFAPKYGAGYGYQAGVDLRGALLNLPKRLVCRLAKGINLVGKCMDNSKSPSWHDLV